MTVSRCCFAEIITAAVTGKRFPALCCIGDRFTNVETRMASLRAEKTEPDLVLPTFYPRSYALRASFRRFRVDRARLSRRARCEKTDILRTVQIAHVRCAYVRLYVCACAKHREESFPVQGISAPMQSRSDLLILLFLPHPSPKPLAFPDSARRNRGRAMYSG